jgi:cell division protein FtsW
MAYSASIAMTGSGVDVNFRFLARHGAHITIGLLSMAIIARTHVSWWQRMGPWLMLVGILLLCAVLFSALGGTVNGSSRWLRIGPLQVQPSEFVKVFMVVYTAGYLTRRREQLGSFTGGIVMIGLVVAVVGTLLLLEPDFGSLVVITATVAGMIFLGGVRFWHFAVRLLIGATGMALLTFASPYRMERVMAFLNPWSDPFDSGFQLVQALIAFGRGELFGVGLGSSVQKLHYLPAANTDFLLAVIAEELGLIGVMAVIVLFGFLIWHAFSIARRAELTGNVFAARLVQGVGLLIGLQAIINMGVNMGVLPTKGLTLPFMSYGGSSLVACCMAAGLLMLVHRETRPKPGGRR